MNFTFHIGRLTKDPELRRTTTGKAVATFSLAVRNDFKNADGNYDSIFLDFVAFDVKALSAIEVFGGISPWYLQHVSRHP